MPPPPPPPQTKQWGNQAMDVIPPQLARIAAMSSHENLGRGSAMTPIINRDEAMREWERRNKGGSNAIMAGSGHQKRNSWQQYPQLEFLQEQAERAASQSYMNQARGFVPQQVPPPPPSNLNVVIDPNSNLQRQQYNYNSATPIDSYGSNDGMGTLYMPLVPPQSSMNSYQSQPPTPSKNYQSPSSAYMIPPSAAAPQPNLIRSYSNSNNTYYDPRYPRQQQR